MPEDRKAALQANEHDIGYMGHGASISRASQVYQGERKINLVAAYFLKRGLPGKTMPISARARRRYSPLSDT